VIKLPWAWGVAHYFNQFWPETVRYDAVNAMLLNEFLKEHRKNEEQGATIARQQKQIEALTAGLQKVSAQVEAIRTAQQVVNNPRKRARPNKAAAFHNQPSRFVAWRLFVSLFSPCSSSRVGSAPFPLFARVILAPVCGRAYSWPATLSCLTRKIKITESRSTSK
jgi:hypothetical protein